MKETSERTIKLGLTRSPKRVVDEIESVTATMTGQGWELTDTIVEESLGNIHLLFEREVDA